MQSHLFFICPTDYLEPIINSSFRHPKYYYSSIGNSVVFDETVVSQITLLIKEQGIAEISFVMSDNNPVLIDALENRGISRISRLNGLYREIIRQKKYADVRWQKRNCAFVLLSLYLNKKIKDLRLKLSGSTIYHVKIGAKIYKQKENVFEEIYSDLICGEYFSLN